MSIFKSSNPTLQEKTYQGTILEGVSVGESMTVNGTMNKFGNRAKKFQNLWNFFKFYNSTSVERCSIPYCCCP